MPRELFSTNKEASIPANTMPSGGQNHDLEGMDTHLAEAWQDTHPIATGDSLSHGTCHLSAVQIGTRHGRATIQDSGGPHQVENVLGQQLRVHRSTKHVAEGNQIGSILP